MTKDSTSRKTWGDGMNQYFGDPDDCYDRKDHDEFTREHPCNDSVFKDIFERSAMEVEEEEKS